MLKEVVVEACHIGTCSTVDKDGVEDVHSDDLILQTLQVARFARQQTFLKVRKFQSFAVKHRIVSAGNAHNVELQPGKGGQLVRTAGASAQLMAKEGKYAQVRLPSGEVRLIKLNCLATIGVVSNGDHSNVSIGKAGRKRHMGIRPTVRGSVMNPCDHPHGGGEGKSPIGKPGPVTPWGKPTLGHKTRSKKKASNKFIVKRRNGR